MGIRSKKEKDMLYKSIMVPYDKTEPAFAGLSEAIRFCQEDPEVELHIVTMVDVETTAEEELNQMSLRSRGHGINMEDLESLRDEILLDEVVKTRASLREQLQQLSNYVTIETVATGNPSEEIITYATEKGCDAIIMGCRNREGLFSSFGSVSRHVVAYSPLPVLVVKGKKK
jgi:nucleotide-binding universal stress UspA family protein